MHFIASHGLDESELETVKGRMNLRDARFEVLKRIIKTD
jgi:hypothetical protein